MIELLRHNTRLAALIAVVVLLLVGIIVLFLQWQSAEDTRKELESDRNSAMRTLGVTSDDYDLAALRAQKLATLQDEKDRLAAAKIPAELPVVQLMLYLADGTGSIPVTITEVKPATGVETEMIGGKPYNAHKTQVTVTGSLTNIISFLRYVEGFSYKSYKSIKLEDVSLSGSGQSWLGKFTIVFITQR